MLDEIVKIEVYNLILTLKIYVKLNFKTVNLFIYDRIFRFEKNYKILSMEICCLVFGKCKTKKFDTRTLLTICIDRE